MASVSPRALSPPPQPAVSTPFERRLGVEWKLLNELVRLNPQRLSEPVADDGRFKVTLSGTPALALQGETLISQHSLCLVYPRFFPSVPLELYLAQPVGHPNIHPETGFVCLWDQHRVENTVEHALLKTVAMLGWRLLNLEARHVMQPDAFQRLPQREQMARQLAAPDLTAVARRRATFAPPGGTRRERLS